MLKDYADKVPAEVKTEVEGKLDEVKKVKDGEDANAIKTAIEQLNEVVSKIGAAMYQQPGAEGATGAGEQASGETTGGDADVKDADFEKKD